MKFVDGFRSEINGSPVVEFTCPVCRESIIQTVRNEDDEGSIVIPLPHGSCKASNVLIRVK